MATDKIQTGIRIEATSLEKARYIAKRQKRTLNSFVEYLVECAIADYEKEHGAIPLAEPQL